MITVTAGPLVSWQATRFGHRSAVVASCLLALAGWLYAFTLPGTLIEIVVLLTVASYGTTMVVTAVTNAIVETVPEDRTSEAIGTMLVVRGFGLAVGAQLIALSLSASTVAAPDNGALFPSAESYRLTMGWIAAATFVAMAVAMLLPAGRRKEKIAAAAIGN
jgi:MFS family permease